MVIPQDFLDALATLPEAEAFFRTLDRKNLYPIYHRLQTAKHLETRARRMQKSLSSSVEESAFIEKTQLRPFGAASARSKSGHSFTPDVTAAIKSAITCSLPSGR